MVVNVLSWRLVDWLAYFMVGNILAQFALTDVDRLEGLLPPKSVGINDISSIKSPKSVNSCRVYVSVAL